MTKQYEDGREIRFQVIHQSIIHFIIPSDISLLVSYLDLIGGDNGKEDELVEGKHSVVLRPTLAYRR